MSSEQFKLKNSTRRHRDESAVKKQVKIAKSHGLTDKDKQIKEPHRYVKHHAMDCGQPGCMLCANPRRNKMFKTKDKLTMHERQFMPDLDNVTDKHSNGLKPKD